jgi:steroid delta-isomerase
MDMELKDIPETSLARVRARDRGGWLALFAEDAVVEDPVGPSDWDPEGKGQQGKAAIGAFYDMFSAMQDSFEYTIHQVEPRGCEVAAVVTPRIGMKDGSVGENRLINIYKQGPDGLIRSLRSFWNA